MVSRLSDKEAQAAASQLQYPWVLDLQQQVISYTFNFDNYYQTMAFANAVAWIAHQYDHHPQMTIGYKTCHIELTTHSAQGLSQLDFSSATAIEQLPGMTDEKS